MRAAKPVGKMGVAQEPAFHCDIYNWSIRINQQIVGVAQA